MRGLEQAVNIKFWPGNAKPARPWGKLKRDPEIWDEDGDTLIYFGRGYEDPSFRISSTLIEETRSETLIDMLDSGMIQAEGSKKDQALGVQYKLYMDAHPGGSKIDVLRYHVTTRNFFAFLLRKPLVGFTFYQALVDLHQRLDRYLPHVDSAVALQSYLIRIGLVNVSNEPRAAAGLLAWSEDVLWANGWREAFVHSVGMYEDLNELQESADISQATTAHLERAHLEVQARVREAEDTLAAFYFDDIHFAQEDEPPTVRATSVRFRKFLKQFYEKEYQSWPVRREWHGLWLDRIIVNRLQEDFSALYEYLVDRNVEWNGGYESEDRKNRVLLKALNAQSLGLDGDDLRMLGVMINLDCRINASHIPHPYPLLPPSIPGPTLAKKSVFGGKKKDKSRESRMAHVYREASNASLLNTAHTDNDLREAFVHFEKTDQPSDIEPREARRERWIIIYSVLQTLAGVSVDVPTLSFTGDVSYFLNTRLHGLPLWSPSERIYVDASRDQSHCWNTARTWFGDHLERRTSQSGFSSCATTESNSQSRPLSPEFLSDTYTSFESSRGTTYSELEARKDGLFPAIEANLSPDPDLLPLEHPVVPVKHPATVDTDRHIAKPLPIRPYHGGQRNPEVRRPK